MPETGTIDRDLAWKIIILALGYIVSNIRRKTRED